MLTSSRRCSVAALIYGDGLTVVNGGACAKDPMPDGFLVCVVCKQIAPRKMKTQILCGSVRCRRRRQYELDRVDGKKVEAARERFRAWYAKNQARQIENVAKRRRRSYGGAVGPWFITPHAVDRFMEYFGEPDREVALGRLINEAGKAHFVKTKDGGAQLWRAASPLRARFIVGPGEGEKWALVTVLPPFDGWKRRREGCDAARE